MAINVLFGTTFILASIFQCIPVHAAWIKWMLRFQLGVLMQVRYRFRCYYYHLCIKRIDETRNVMGMEDLYPGNVWPRIFVLVRKGNEHANHRYLVSYD
jgi:hypothetical protein